MENGLVSFDSNKFLATATEEIQILTGDPVIRAKLRRYDSEENFARKIGGYFCMTDLSGRLLLLAQIGGIPADKVYLYQALAREGVERLARHPAHDVARESTNEERNKFGGAVKFVPYTFAFVSGLSWMFCEYVMYQVALRSGVAQRAVVQERLRHWPNDFEMVDENN